jgi:hypothetical protein
MQMPFANSSFTTYPDFAQVTHFLVHLLSCWYNEEKNRTMYFKGLLSIRNEKIHIKILYPPVSGQKTLVAIIIC